MQKLNDQELQSSLAALPQWSLRDGRVVREWTFEDFVTAMEFVNRVATLAESRGHHPDIAIRYNRVTLSLITHDADGITESDTSMCAFLDQNL